MSAEDETLAELIAALDASHYGISEAGTCHGCDDFWPCPPARAAYLLARIPGMIQAEREKPCTHEESEYDEPECMCACGRATINPSWAKCLNCL